MFELLQDPTTHCFTNVKTENILVGNWTTHALVKVPKMFLTSGGQRFHSWRHNKDGEIKMADEVNFQR